MHNRPSGRDEHFLAIAAASTTGDSQRHVRCVCACGRARVCLHLLFTHIYFGQGSIRLPLNRLRVWSICCRDVSPETACRDPSRDLRCGGRRARLPRGVSFSFLDRQPKRQMKRRLATDGGEERVIASARQMSLSGAAPATFTFPGVELQLGGQGKEKREKSGLPNPPPPSPAPSLLSWTDHAFARRGQQRKRAGSFIQRNTRSTSELSLARC